MSRGLSPITYVAEEASPIELLISPIAGGVRQDREGCLAPSLQKR